MLKDKSIRKMLSRMGWMRSKAHEQLHRQIDGSQSEKAGITSVYGMAMILWKQSRQSFSASAMNQGLPNSGLFVLRCPY
jgi:hypothetical protein